MKKLRLCLPQIRQNVDISCEIRETPAPLRKAHKQTRPLRSSPVHGVGVLKRTDRGSDEVEAEGNVDGHPMENIVYKNDIYSERDEVWKMEQSDYNNFWVSCC